MHFALTEEQAAIVEAVRAMLAERCTPADLRRQLASGEPLDAARWATIRDMGLLGVCVDEEHGGLGLGMVEMAAIAEAAGHVALPEPLVEQAGIVAPLLARLGVPPGDGIIAIGHPANPLVADADQAGALLLPRDGAIHLVPRAEVELTRAESFDPFRRLFRVDWIAAPGTPIGTDWGDTAERGMILAAAQMIGLGQRCIAMAVDHARGRQQFGKPIGSYQAVKHLLADAQVAIEFARPVVQAAAAEMALGTLAARARAAHAFLAAGEAADRAARTAVQVHGAMGMTWEVDLHFFLKRARALRTAWSTPARAMATVLERLDTLPAGPETLFASALADGS